MFLTHAQTPPAPTSLNQCLQIQIQKKFLIEECADGVKTSVAREVVVVIDAAATNVQIKIRHNTHCEFPSCHLTAGFGADGFGSGSTPHQSLFRHHNELGGGIV